MDNLKEILNRWLSYRGTHRPSVPREPQQFEVESEPEYREDEVAFVIGLENANG